MRELLGTMKYCVPLKRNEKRKQKMFIFFSRSNLFPQNFFLNSVQLNFPCSEWSMNQHETKSTLKPTVKLVKLKFLQHFLSK